MLEGAKGRAGRIRETEVQPYAVGGTTLDTSWDPPEDGCEKPSMGDVRDCASTTTGNSGRSPSPLTKNLW